MITNLGVSPVELEYPILTQTQILGLLLQNAAKCWEFWAPYTLPNFKKKLKFGQNTYFFGSSNIAHSWFGVPILFNLQ